MKVLHIHSGNLYGGVETFLATLARSRHLAPSMETSAALCFDGRIAAELRREGVPTSLLGAVRLRRPDSIWRARRALTQVLRRGGCDAAVCHQAWPLAIFGPVVKAAAVPLVSWIHMAHDRHWIDRLASRVVPDLIVCNSKFTASTLPPTSVPIEIAYYPVSAATGAIRAKDDLRRELDTPPDDVVITQVSRMESLKGHIVCLEALARLRDQPGWTCWQVGGAQRAVEQSYLESLRAAAERLGISSRIRFTGQRTDVSAVLAATDIFCQPNLAPEGFGITFIEAMRAGLPVVTTAMGGALEIVDDTCGVLLSPGGPTALASALGDTLLRLVTNRGERTRLGEAGRQRARILCDPALQMNRISDVLENVCRPTGLSSARAVTGWQRVH